MNFSHMDHTFVQLILILLQFGVTGSLTIPSIKTDESALFALKSFVTNDPQNLITRNWSASTPVCSWIGVTCSKKHQRLIVLNISHMNLQGSIPPHLGNLSFLVSLNMRNNSFDGSLPHELSKLHRLRSIDLRINNLGGPFPSFLTSLPNLNFLHLSRNGFSGHIPASIGNVSTLQVLTLNLNSFEGKIPQEIGNLHNLTLLNLEGNRLTGQIPSTIFNLSALQYIALTGNGLSGALPASVCDNLPMLEGLYLSSNWLNGSIPMSLQKCDQLQVLSLSGNNFTGSIPKEIRNLTRLRVLHLGANELEGPIPMEMGNLQKLEVFGLSRNYLSGSLPASIFNISALEVFTLARNQFSGNLPSNFGQGTPNLQEIYFSTNSFSGVIPDSISNASKLTVLELSSNELTGRIPDSLGSLQYLYLLNLGGNQFINPSPASELAFLTSLSNCQLLKELVILGNPLDGTIPASIGNFSSLEIFAAYRCRIHGNIPEEIGNLSSIAMLSLADNELIGSIPNSAIRLQKLQQLYLSNNKIIGSISDDICSLKNLGALDLSQNQFSGALPGCIGNMSSLRNLYFASNRLSLNLPASIWNLNDLLQFNASSNMLSGQIPPEIGNLKAATLIDLAMNDLSGNIPTTIGALESLMNLSLAHNRLQGPIPDSLGKVLSLESLDFSHNNLTGEIPKSLEALIYLRYFNVSFNKLSGEIPNGGPFVNFTSRSFMSNEALCGDSRFLVPPCQFSSHKRPRRKRGLHIALYIVLGVASIILTLAGIVLLLLRRRKQRKTQSSPLPLMTSHERISYNELVQATNGFSKINLLGMGSYGNVYKGILKDRTTVAVKVFNLQVERAFKSFDTECEVLRSLRHRNLIKVINACTNHDFKALVLEYMPNGNLEQWLYSHNYFLDISQRLNIMIDVARALDYLHNDYIIPVIHCDLKPSNVLLNTDLVGHVSDFGISKLQYGGETTAQTRTIATIGYMAPEYGSEGLVSTKSDIYSYGILLIETFTRKKPFDNMFSGELTLKHWVEESLPHGITQIIDSNLLNQQQQEEEEEKEIFDAKVQCLLSVMELGLKCTEELADSRISMKETVTALNKIKLQLLISSRKNI